MDELSEGKRMAGGGAKGMNTFVISIPFHSLTHIIYTLTSSRSRGITHTQLFKKLSVTFVHVCTHSSASVFMFTSYANSYNMPLIYYLYQYQNVWYCQQCAMATVLSSFHVQLEQSLFDGLQFSISLFRFWWWRWCQKSAQFRIDKMYIVRHIIGITMGNIETC